MDDPSWPSVSIVFLAYNRRDELAISLEEVTERLDYPSDRLEVLVVDNASSDRTSEMVRSRFPSVQLIRTPKNVGVSGWNVGLSSAQGEYILALDDDCYITGTVLKDAVSAATQRQADLVSFRVRSGDSDYYFNDEYLTGLLTFWGCSVLFSRRAVDNLSPIYDPNIFIWANEMELTIRLLDAGMRHLHLPEIVSVHMKPPSPAFHDLATRMNTRHFTYIAAKLLRPADAIRAVANVAVNVVFQSYSIDRRALRALSEIPRGLQMGVRARAPVRPKVSRIYRDNVWHFANQLSLTRSPLERLQGLGDSERTEGMRRSRTERWYQRRAQFYPTSSAVLDLPDD